MEGSGTGQGLNQEKRNQDAALANAARFLVFVTLHNVYCIYRHLPCPIGFKRELLSWRCRDFTRVERGLNGENDEHHVRDEGDRRCSGRLLLFRFGLEQVVEQCPNPVLLVDANCERVRRIKTYSSIHHVDRDFH